MGKWLPKTPLMQFVLFAVLLVAALIWTHIGVYAQSSFRRDVFYSVRLALLGLAGLSLLRGLIVFVLDPARPERSKRVALGAATFAVVLLLLEAGFMFIPQSHGVGHTLGAKIWFRHYWNPINSMNYRDKEHSQVDLENSTRVYVVGDSFTAGHGIKRASDRFSDRLATMLPRDYRVVNLGRNGLDSRAAYEALVRMPMHPDILVLQYFGIDIEQAALEADLTWEGFKPYDDLSDLGMAVIKNSYLANFVYWQFPRADTKSYIEFLVMAYRTPAVFEHHAADLMKFVDYADRHSTPLVVVVFPYLANTGVSEFYTEPIADLFRKRDVRVIDVANVVARIPANDRVVNANDGHASVLVHRLVAEGIHDSLVQMDAIPK